MVMGAMRPRGYRVGEYICVDKVRAPRTYLIDFKYVSTVEDANTPSITRTQILRVTTVVHYSCENLLGAFQFDQGLI